MAKRCPKRFVSMFITLICFHVGLWAQFPDANWSPVIPAVFAVYDPYPPGTPRPVPSRGYRWKLNRLNARLSPGGWDDRTACRYDDSYHSGLDGPASEAPMNIYDQQGKRLAGIIKRYDLINIYRTVRLVNVRGFGLDARFTGEAATAPGKYFQQAAFYHSQRCYTAATEFGFRRFVAPGSPGGYIQFYYGINVNCDYPGKCRKQSGEALRQEGRHIDLDYRLEPPCPPPGTRFLYEAWLSDDAWVWNVAVRDADSLYAIRCSAQLPVEAWFRDFALAMRHGGGLAGFITLTSQHNGVARTSSAMDVKHVFAPYY